MLDNGWVDVILVKNLKGRSVEFDKSHKTKVYIFGRLAPSNIDVKFLGKFGEIFVGEEIKSQILRLIFFKCIFLG